MCAMVINDLGKAVVKIGIGISKACAIGESGKRRRRTKERKRKKPNHTRKDRMVIYKSQRAHKTISHLL